MQKILIKEFGLSGHSVVVLNENQNITECIFEVDSENIDNESKKNHKNRKANKGDIYLAKVSRVENSLNAVFLEYENNSKSAFLPASEIHEMYSDDQDKDLEIESNANEEMSQVSHDDKNHDNEKEKKIQDIIEKGQTLLVQIVKNERGNKGVAVTTYISIPGRFMVLMPNSKKGVSISRKIQDPVIRKKMSDILENINNNSNMGIILRTLAMNATHDELLDDYNYLINLWKDILNKVAKSKVPNLIYQEIDIIKQVIRDNFDAKKDSEIIVTNQEIKDNLIKFIDQILPKHKSKIVLYQDKIPLYKKYNIDSKIQNLLSERVELKSGGYLIINHTEALTAIDVNSGQGTSGGNIEETAYIINLEAATEAARQIILRNIGGLIVIDFIDMMKIENRKKIELCIKDNFSEDRAKVQFTKISNFGLLEISRQRLRPNLSEILMTKCLACEHGLIKSEIFMFENIFDNLIYMLEHSKNKHRSLTLIAVENAIDSITKNHKEKILDIEKKYKIQILLKKQYFIKPDHYLIKLDSKDENGKSVLEVFNSIKMQEKSNSIFEKIKKLFIKK